MKKLQVCSYLTQHLEDVLTDGFGVIVGGFIDETEHVRCQQKSVYGLGAFAHNRPSALFKAGVCPSNSGDSGKPSIQISAVVYATRTTS